MEPFRVTCETCRSRLKVRGAEAIGEIHACPKCGSMVQIVPPADWPGHEATPVAAAALLSPRVEPAVVLSTSASTIVPAEFAFDLPTVAPTSTPTPTSVVPVEQPVAAIPEPAAGGSPILVWGLSAAAVFAVAALTYVLWPSGAKQVAQPTPPVAATPAPPDEQKPAPQPAATDDKTKSAVEPDPFSVDQLTDTAPETTNTSPAAPAPAEAKPTNTESTTPAATVVAKPTETSAPADMLKEAVAAATATPPVPPVLTDRPDAAPSNAAAGAEHVLKFDPLDFDPEHLSLSSKPTAVAASAGPSASSIPAIPPPAEAERKPAADAKPVLSNDLLPAEPQKAVNVKRGPVAGDDARPLDTAQHLALKLKSFQVSEMPLARFVDTVADMAGAPITLDPVTLELNGLSPRTPISVDAADATLESILHDAFTRQRLELADGDGRIAAKLANADEVRAVDFEVKDLVSGGDAAPVAKLIQQFVAPYAWKPTGGKGTIEVQGTNLHITNSLTVRREALIFCERLRLARNLPLKSKYPPALLTVDSPYNKLATTLAKPTTFTFLAWTPLNDVLRQWHEASSLTILVDWPALREVELTPTTPIACSSIDRPWNEAIDGILEPLGLGWWPSDSQTIQITSLEALARMDRVEFFAVPKTTRAEHGSPTNLVAAIKKDIEERLGDKAADIRIEFDEPGGRLIVRANPAVQRYLSAQLAASQK